MNCTQIEHLIPLYVGGDLDSRMAHTVHQHIETCGHCRGVASGFEESREWLRNLGAPQLDEAIFDDLRAAIHRDICSTEGLQTKSRLTFLRSVGKTRFATEALKGRYRSRSLVAAATLLLIAALAIYGHWRRAAAPQVVTHTPAQGSTEQKPEEPKYVETAKTGLSPRMPKHHRPHRNHGNESNSASMPAALPLRSPAIIELPAPPEKTAEILISQLAVPGTAATDQEMLRIEFQTADPNIRIIWLVAKNSGMSPIRSNSQSAGKAAGKFDSNTPEEDGGLK